jgi:hypothetical protein
MKSFAYADPPYLGRAEYYRAHHPNAMIWDKPDTHQALIGRLQAEYPDGWALSLSERSLRTILPMCKAVPVRKHFEPVIFCGGRDYADTGNRTADFIVTKQEPLPAGQPRYAMQKGELRSGQTFVGRKPAAFAHWILDLLGWLPGDTIDDLFPGSGAVTAAWKTRQGTIAFPSAPHATDLALAVAEEMQRGRG